MELDFNIDNYNIDELVKIVKLETKLPLTGEKITKHIKNLIKDEKRDNIKKFYKTVGAYLIYHFDTKQRNKENLDKHDDLDGDGEDSDHEFFTEMQHTLIVNETSELRKDFADHVVKGNKNPNYVNHVFENIFLSSSMRKKIPSITFCNKAVAAKEIYTSSDYILDLETLKKDVLSFYITDVTIPKTWYTFDSEYGTSSFMVDETIYKIENGNYSPTELVAALNNLNNTTYLNSIYVNLQPTQLTFSYDSNTKKITIRNLATKNRTITWFFKIESCGRTNRGSKMNYNMGVLLGFDDISYTISSSEASSSVVFDPVTGVEMKKYEDRITGINVVDTVGSTHFFVSIDDYNNNKPNQSITSTKQHTENYKFPTYYNPETMEISFNTLDVNALDNAVYNNNIFNNGNSCVSLPNNPDNPKVLTKNQKFTILRLAEEMRRSKSNNDDIQMIQNINIPDVVATIPVNKDEIGMVNWSFSEEQNDKRIYFGPVRLSKLRIRLYNDKGYLVNLNGSNWSFKMILKRLYQL